MIINKLILIYVFRKDIFANIEKNSMFIILFHLYKQ